MRLRSLCLLVAPILALVWGCSRAEPPEPVNVPAPVAPTPTPTVVPAPSPSASAVPQPSPSPTVAVRPQPTPTPVPKASAVASSTVAPSPSSEEIPLAELIEVRFARDAYEFTLAEAARGVRLNYAIVVHDNAWAAPQLQDTGGAGSAGPGGLYPFAEIRGNDQYFGLRDLGRGPGKQRPRFFLKKGTYSATIAWDGRNWTGPSDTMRPKGVPFPPGTYEARVSLTGQLDRRGTKLPYNVEAVTKVVLTE